MGNRFHHLFTLSDKTKNPLLGFKILSFKLSFNFIFIHPENIKPKDCYITVLGFNINNPLLICKKIGFSRKCFFEIGIKT